MGLFSAIKDFVSPVTDLVSAFKPVGDLFSLGSSASSLYNSVTNSSFHDQKDLMKYQAELQDYFWTKQYGQRHQLEVDDLKKAGLNPILSANSAGSVAGVSASAAPNETRSQKLATSAALANAFSQARLADSTTLLNSAQASAVAKDAETRRLVGQSNIDLNNVQAAQMLKYPPNQSVFEKNVRGAGHLSVDLLNYLRSFRSSHSARYQSDSFSRYPSDSSSSYFYHIGD